MFAVVARGVAVGPRAAGARIVPLRMIHALLFLAASIVSPGACGAACCSDAAGWKGPPTCCAAAGHPTPEPAAADGCCGKACCTAAAPRSAPAETVAPVNGQPGADCGCHCESAPRGVPAPRSRVIRGRPPPPCSRSPDRPTPQPCASVRSVRWRRRHSSSNDRSGSASGCGWIEQASVRTPRASVWGAVGTIRWRGHVGSAWPARFPQSIPKERSHDVVPALGRDGHVPGLGSGSGCRGGLRHLCVLRLLRHRHLPVCRVHLLLLQRWLQGEVIARSIDR